MNLSFDKITKAGGPAFPVVEDDDRTSAYGITVRDYFAAQFMARAQSLCEDRGGWSMETTAQCAYQMADAMLSARAS